MTNNQINYLNYLETARSNRSRETETSRHNVQSEKIDIGKLAETQRSNLISEAETNRSNVARENINLATLAETKRHNVAYEQTLSEKNAVSKYIAELENSIAQANLNFQESKEAQRIVESPRDYELALGKTVVEGVDRTVNTAVGASRTAAAAAIGGALGGRKPSAASSTTTATTVGSILSKAAKNVTALPIIIKQIMPDTISSGQTRGDSKIKG